MAEKRIKINIDKSGNVSAKTVSGFAGTNCEETMDNVFAVINGSLKDQGDTDERFKDDGPLDYIISGN